MIDNVIGWPSAVILALAHSWSPVFSSNVILDVARAIVLGFAGFVVLPFAVMGLGPCAVGQPGRDSSEPLSARSLLLLLAVTLGPTIILALIFYGHV